MGEHIRRKVAAGFPQGEASKVTKLDEWTKFAEHLENIANDKALKAHPRLYQSTSTGLDLEECRGVVSTTFLEYLKEQEGGLFKSKK